MQNAECKVQNEGVCLRKQILILCVAYQKLLLLLTILLFQIIAKRYNHFAFNILNFALLSRQWRDKMEGLSPCD